MAESKVKFFDGSRGFGFIARDDGNADIFLHISGLARRGEFLAEGVRVSFDEMRLTTKESAINVTVLSGT